MILDFKGIIITDGLLMIRDYPEKIKNPKRDWKVDMDEITVFFY